jgi:hypothetical protein
VTPQRVEHRLAGGHREEGGLCDVAANRGDTRCRVKRAKARKSRRMQSQTSITGSAGSRVVPCQTTLHISPKTLEAPGSPPLRLSPLRRTKLFQNSYQAHSDCKRRATSRRPKYCWAADSWAVHVRPKMSRYGPTPRGLHKLPHKPSYNSGDTRSQT